MRAHSSPPPPAADGAVAHPSFLLGRLEYLRVAQLWSEQNQNESSYKERETYLERTQQAFVDAHHCTRVIKLAAVVGRAEQRN